jgi:hypothetical protein
VLTWGTAGWFATHKLDPLESLIDASRPAWLQLLGAAGRSLLIAYGVTFALGLAVLPLVAARYHLVSLVGLLIGPSHDEGSPRRRQRTRARGGTRLR